MPGSRDAYRHAPLLHPDDLLSEISSKWALLATCVACAHHKRIGRISNIARVRGLQTAGELLSAIRCRKCGARRPHVRVVYEP
jgi:hypothetical protein